MLKLISVTALMTGVAATPAYAQDSAAPSRIHVFAVGGYDKVDGEGAAAEGLAYGIGGGFDFGVHPDWSLGVEGEISSAATDDCRSGFVRPGDDLCFEAGRDLYVGGRVAFRVGKNRNSLFYLGGGYTNAAVEIDYDANLPGTTDDFARSEELDGIRGKIGTELGLGANAFVKLEYRFSWYGSEDLERHQAVGGVGFRF